MKDVTKIISEKATRFLAVDMKDRLKSAFNRNNAPGNPPDEEAPDYSAIFNANRVPGTEKQSRFSPLDQTQIAEPTTSVTMRNPARQIAHDIEEAEIVVEAGEEHAASSDWVAASLKTRKPEAAVEPRPASPTPEIAHDTPDYSAIFKNNKSTIAESKPAHQTFDASPSDRGFTEKRVVGPKAEERKPIFTAELKPVFKPEAKPVFKQEPTPQLETEANTSKHEEVVAQKPKSRFFGDFTSTESVRLKVEKRAEEPGDAGPKASSSEPQTQAARVEPKPAEVKAHNADVHKAASSVPEAKPLEQPSDADRGAAEAVASRPATSEQANINKKENASMDAKGQDSENGVIRTDANAAGSAIAIERNSKFSGQLKFSGAIAIDGQVDGELVAERIVVHEGGVVNATVEGNTVVVAGTVKGDIYARNELEILPSGVVHGSVTAPAINVRRGGRVEGRCAIGVPRQ